MKPSRFFYYLCRWTCAVPVGLLMTVALLLYMAFERVFGAPYQGMDIDLEVIASMWWGLFIHEGPYS